MSSTTAQVNAALPMVVIRPSNGWVSLQLSELWAYRELVYFLVWRDFKVRYKQTAIGIAWAVVQPVFAMVVFSIFFGRLAKMPSDGVPYPVFAYCGLLPWQFFAHALTESANSVVGNERLITKVYFPRLAIPFASVLSGFVDFGIAFVVLLAMMRAYGLPLTWTVLLLPYCLLLALGAALGAGLWLSALNVTYRDVRYTVPFLTQVWLFATPVIYPSSLLPPTWRTLYGLNPMAGVVEGFRWALLGKGTELGGLLMVSTIVVFVLLVGGLFYFRQAEKTFADVI